MDSYIILTNNPLAARKLEGRRTVCYISVPMRTAQRGRKRICQGPQAFVTPSLRECKAKRDTYKSIMLSGKKEEWTRHPSG